jgi:hypothetical protein
MSKPPSEWALEAADRAIADILPTLDYTPSDGEVAETRAAMAAIFDNKIIDPMVEGVTAQLKAMIPAGGKMGGGFATGGISKLSATPMPEGVVGYGQGGKPVYDGEWFDQQMSTLGPGITVKVSGLQAMRDRFDALPETTRSALVKAMAEHHLNPGGAKR